MWLGLKSKQQSRQLTLAYVGSAFSGCMIGGAGSVMIDRQAAAMAGHHLEFGAKGKIAMPFAPSLFALPTTTAAIGGGGKRNAP